MELKINDKLYKYATCHILEYKIIEIQTLKTMNYTQVFYIAECLSCNDHAPCIVALKINDRRKIEYSHMINEDESNPQHFWHTGEDFLLTKKDALLYVWDKQIDYHSKIIDESKKNIKERENIIAEYKTKIDAIKNLKEVDESTNI